MSKDLVEAVSVFFGDGDEGVGTCFCGFEL